MDGRLCFLLGEQREGDEDETAKGRAHVQPVPSLWFANSIARRGCTGRMAPETQEADVLFSEENKHRLVSSHRRRNLEVKNCSEHASLLRFTVLVEMEGAEHWARVLREDCIARASESRVGGARRSGSLPLGPGLL